MSQTFMECGHAANGRKANGDPVCVICCSLGGDDEGGTIAKDIPNLEGRRAQCPYTDCLKTEPSSLDLPFFEFRGAGSKMALTRCKNCKFAEVAHTDENRRKRTGVCREFVPHGAYEFDNYYCGCKGWD